MTTQIGLVGPKDSVQQMQRIIKEYPNFTAVPIIYKELEEAPTCLNQTTVTIDQWLFSGQAPFSLCLQKGLIMKENAWFVPHEGSSLLGTFLKAFYHTEQNHTHVSLDTVSPEYTNWLIEEFSLSHLSITLFDYPDYVEEDKLIAFHKEAFITGKATLALTCLRGVYRALKQVGIPCYRIKPAEPVTRNILGRIQERVNFLHVKKAQIAVVGVLVSFSQTEQKEIAYSYKLKHQELLVRKRLLDYAESLQGSFLELGNGYFEIFTTRGEIENQGWPYEIIEDIKQAAKLTVYLGVGYGRTALAASKHVQVAIDYSKQAEDEMIVLVDEEKHVSEAKRNEETLHYQQVQLGQDVSNIAVSPATISRLYAKVSQQTYTYFSSQDVASWLNSTERNARRILHALEKGDVIEQAGEEQSGRRGRPRRVYQFKKESVFNQATHVQK
ncbi:hypothetical protein [Shouchella lehensis]|uniref:Transcriptional regulator n=2 Tax=Shouchella lehensis TaxID=300825 RepID=A0A060M2H8_9BACI|nr:hypothetical protein [Shouchella lehensis]AIC94299.1 hypothetical protein BleG1_1721 [Shouchella lehensis G1]MBG9785904.1 hypothetical protein [Shouchella lehensis]RQW20203.1 hypothetical protein EH196_08690 [Bacillus sp. C1-1]TES48377.1 hypothetical protein E2L03_14775 [Shouchella lehensis]